MDQIDEDFASRLDRRLADREQELLMALTDYVDITKTNELRGAYHAITSIREEIRELAQQWIGAEPLPTSITTTNDGTTHHGYAEHGIDA